METENDFLEIAIVKEIEQKIDQINAKCEGQKGQLVVDERVKQVAYSKILCKVYDKDIRYLVRAYTNLGTAYLDINYCQQAREHLLKALTMNEEQSETDLDDDLKEFQIKILINLARSYQEPDKSLQKPKNEKEKKNQEEQTMRNIVTSLDIAQRCLKMNQMIKGKDHISNADIYYIISKANTKLQDYNEVIKNLDEMFLIYEDYYGKDSEKVLKLYMEKGQIYGIQEQYNDAIDCYLKAYEIFEKITTDDNYEELFKIAMIMSDIYIKMQNEDSNKNAYEILKQTDEKYSSSFERSDKDKFLFQQKRAVTCNNLRDKEIQLEEYSRLEEILAETGVNPKSHADTCVSLAYIYREKRDKGKYTFYMEKAKEIYKSVGNTILAEDIEKRIQESNDESEELDDDMENQG